jgi:hypothetical protein
MPTYTAAKARVKSAPFVGRMDFPRSIHGVSAAVGDVIVGAKSRLH